MLTVYYFVLYFFKEKQQRANHMTEKSNTTWFQLIGTAIKQHKNITALERQIYNTHKDILPIIEENSIPDVDICIQSFKEEPSHCGISFYNAIFGTPILVAEPQHNIFCPHYSSEKQCTNDKCAVYQTNKKYFDLKQQYQEARQIQKNTIRQIFGLKTK